jgi:hypothetical protein
MRRLGAVPDPTLPLTGGCGCGAVRYQITQPLVGAIYCHCTRCQRRSGSGASASAHLAPGSLEITAGEQHLRDWAPGGGFAKVYCGECGSAVLVRNPATGEIAMVRLGTIDGDPGVRPSARQFVAYAAAWEPIPDDGLPRYDERMPAPG